MNFKRIQLIPKFQNLCNWIFWKLMSCSMKSNPFSSLFHFFYTLSTFVFFFLNPKHHKDIERFLKAAFSGFISPLNNLLDSLIKIQTPTVPFYMHYWHTNSKRIMNLETLHWVRWHPFSSGSTFLDVFPFLTLKKNRKYLQLCVFSSLDSSHSLVLSPFSQWNGTILWFLRLKANNFKLILKIHSNCVYQNMHKVDKVHKVSAQAHKLYSEDVLRLRGEL